MANVIVENDAKPYIVVRLGDEQYGDRKSDV